MFPIAQAYVERVVLVTDDAIRDAQHALWNQLRIVAEPGGAAAFAALLSRSYVPQRDERVGVVVCGGETSTVHWNEASVRRRRHAVDKRLLCSRLGFVDVGTGHIHR